MNDVKQTKQGSMNTVGFWVAEKKCKKFGVATFIEKCRKLNMEVIKLDLTKPLDEQGPFDIIIHKITPMYALALDGDTEACDFAVAFEEYLEKCPKTIVLDPVLGVHTLIRRTATYALLKEVTKNDDKITTPPYIELEDSDIREKRKKLSNSGVTFPIVCKPIFGCGTTSAHEMAIVMSSTRLGEWNGGPCVAQSFIPHGAVLYKLYVIGQIWHLDVRPSLKNFRATDAPTVHFNSANVSKADSCSPLSKLDQSDIDDPTPKPDMAIFDRIVSLVRRSFGMDLIGIDVLINSKTACYAIIDVNPFPSFDNFPDVHQVLAELARQKIDSNIGAIPKKMDSASPDGLNSSTLQEKDVRSRDCSPDAPAVKRHCGDEAVGPRSRVTSGNEEMSEAKAPKEKLQKDARDKAINSGLMVSNLLSDAVERQIQNDEYVDFVDLIYPNSRNCEVEGWRNVSPEPLESKEKPHLTPANWCDAFDEYAIHYGNYFPNELVDLLLYGQNIKSMIRMNKKNWLNYDETFRRERKSVGCAWTKYRDDICPPVVLGGENNQGIPTNNGTLAIENGTTSVPINLRPKKILTGYCFNFNTSGVQCKIVDCKFKHLCPDCDGEHPVYYHKSGEADSVVKVEK